MLKFLSNPTYICQNRQNDADNHKHRHLPVEQRLNSKWVLVFDNVTLLTGTVVIPPFNFTHKYKRRYRFRVAAVNALGTGPWTSTQTIHLRTMSKDTVIRALGEADPTAVDVLASESGPADAVAADMWTNICDVHMW